MREYLSLASYDERSRFFSLGGYLHSVEKTLEHWNSVIGNINSLVSEANRIACSCFGEQESKSSAVGLPDVNLNELSRQLVSLGFLNTFTPSRLKHEDTSFVVEQAFESMRIGEFVAPLEREICTDEVMTELVEEFFQMLGISSDDLVEICQSLGVDRLCRLRECSEAFLCEPFGRVYKK